jgi:hypothetical protein
MGYTIKFDTTIEWDITDEDIKQYSECKTPEAFIKYQEASLKSSMGYQSLEDFVANGIIRKGNWAVYTEDAVDMGGDWKAD